MGNKLVRDKIPDLITANGEIPITRTLDKDEYLTELVKKLQEECDEFKEALDLEELADIQEVILAIADVIASRTELEVKRQAKSEERGGFEKRIFLRSVER